MSSSRLDPGSVSPSRAVSPPRASINLLPPELTLAILELCAASDPATLLSTALVSREWSGITHSLLLRRVTLGPDAHHFNALIAAIRAGPPRWVCEQLAFRLDLSDRVTRLVREAHEVEGVVIDCDCWDERGYRLGSFFGSSALDNLSSLTFRSGSCRPLVELGVFPRRLVSLTLGRFWVDELGRDQLGKLLKSSRGTIKKLTVECGEDEQSARGLALAQEAVQSAVRELELTLLRSHTETVNAVRQFHHLHTLYIESGRVQVITNLVATLGTEHNLREVTLVFLGCSLASRVDDLLSCIAAPSLAGLAKLTIKGAFIDSLRQRRLDKKLFEAAETNKVGQLSFERHAQADGRL